jgi:hypothetical protein
MGVRVKIRHLISLAALTPVAVFAVTMLAGSFDHGSHGIADAPTNHVVRSDNPNGDLWPPDPNGAH